MIFDSSVTIGSGINGYANGGMEGFAGGVFGSGLVTGAQAYANRSQPPPSQEAPNGFWDTVVDIGFFVESVRQYNENPGWATGLGLFANSLALLAPGVSSYGTVNAAVKAELAAEKAASKNLVIGKFKNGAPDFGVRANEKYFSFENLGSTKANYQQNMRALRVEMRTGNPIRDATPGIGGNFTKGERMTLENRGWKEETRGSDIYWIKGD